MEVKSSQVKSGGSSGKLQLELGAASGAGAGAGSGWSCKSSQAGQVKSSLSQVKSSEVASGKTRLG